MSAFTFTVYGTEFCRLLEAVACFQSRPKDFPTHAAVRCFVRHDGLTMVASNVASTAVGTISTAEQDGTGILSLPYAQVRVVLAMFKRPLPKGATEHEYVLEVEVTSAQIRIREISGLFDNDQLLIAVVPAEDLGLGEHSDDEHAMHAAAAVASILERSTPFLLAPHHTINGSELALFCKAARITGVPLYLRTTERHLLGILSDSDGAGPSLVMSSFFHERDADEGRHDATTLAEYRGRLDELVDQAVL